MGCLKLHTEKNYTTLKVVYSAVNTSVLEKQEEKNNTAFLEVVYRNAQGNGGGDLGAVGNFIRSQAGSEFSQSLFTNYWQAGGNMTLSQSRFNSIVQAAGRVQSVSPVTLVNGQPGIAKVHSFYGSAEYAKAFGSATIYYNQGGSPVGFNDTYNFNWRWQWGDGSRSIIAEQQTRAVSVAGFFYGAQPFNIKYGIGVRP
jgi:hypothetical protein